MNQIRAWILGYDQMVGVSNIDFDENGEPQSIITDCAVDYDFEDGGRWEFSASEFVLMRSTGMKDKKGDEIFEYDIVEFKSSDGRLHQKQVSFDDHEAIWIKGDYELRHYRKTTVIVGNIFENPNLLLQK